MRWCLYVFCRFNIIFGVQFYESNVRSNKLYLTFLKLYPREIDFFCCSSESSSTRILAIFDETKIIKISSGLKTEVANEIAQALFLNRCLFNNSARDSINVPICSSLTSNAMFLARLGKITSYDLRFSYNNRD